LQLSCSPPPSVVQPPQHRCVPHSHYEAGSALLPQVSYHHPRSGAPSMRVGTTWSLKVSLARQQHKGSLQKESYGKLTAQLACRTNPLGVCTCVSPLGAARGIHLGSPSVPSHKHGLAALRPALPGPPRSAPGTPQQGLAKPRGCGTRPLALGQGVQPGLAVLNEWRSAIIRCCRDLHGQHRAHLSRTRRAKERWHSAKGFSTGSLC
jgi:hypothetical protein